MANYLLLQYGTMPPKTDEDLAKTLSDWATWFNELGENLVDGGSPLNFGGSIGKVAEGTDGSAGGRSGGYSSGYTIIKAANLEGAREVAKGCPTAKKGGWIDVYAIYPVMTGGSKQP